MIDRIVSYASQGFSSTAIASMVNTSPEYVEQILQDPQYKSLILTEQQKFATLKADTELESSYTQLEKRILRQVTESLPFAEFRDLTRAMETLIRRKQQLSMHEHSSFVVNGNAQFNTVVLSIPRAAAPEITLNSQREVIAIGNKSLAPMQAGAVRSLFDTIQKKKEQALLSKREQQTQQMQQYIPRAVDVTTIPEDF